jgi:phosphopantetheinyl transferase
VDKIFSTPHYKGAWFSFTGDRMSLRSSIQTLLRTELSDPEGNLGVGDSGPEWKGTKAIDLSYSHSGRFALLVWTSTHRIGVDLEPMNRDYSHAPLELAKRFFHPNEFNSLSRNQGSPPRLSQEFLDLWLKKEAYAKLTRHGLKDSIRIETSTIPSVRFEIVPVIPIGYDARVALL